MKFLCVECDEAMRLERTGGPDSGSMTVLFVCPSCDRKIAMLTNAMETQMVRSLGVKIGAASSRSTPPMETIHSSLTAAPAQPHASPTEPAAGAVSPLTSSANTSGKDAGMGKCPFTGTVNQAFEQEARASEGPVWTHEARERLDRIPAYVRAMVEKGILEYAKEKGIAEIDGAVLDEARGSFGM